MAVFFISGFFCVSVACWTRIYSLLVFYYKAAAPSAFDMPEGPNSAFLTMALYATLVFVQSISGVSASADGKIRAFTPAIFWDYPDSMLWSL
jgi:hypothetical protein